jgi:amino acid transporter
MFEALSGIACFVTGSVSFLYGTRIAWVCGKKCNFKENPENKRQALFESIPTAALVYSFGFMIIFSLCISGFLTILVSSLTSAILLSNLVVSMAMPELRRKPPTR